MLSLLGAIVALGLLIMVHEAGHYIVARRCKMRVDRFSIGFGPPILSWRRGETDFTIGPIPFGGFVQIRGMTVADEVEADDERSYPNRPAWQRFATIFAGPATNYLFAIVLALTLYGVAGRESGTAWYEISGVQDGWPAAGALEAGDRIVKLDGQPYYMARGKAEYPSLQAVLAERKEAPFRLGVVRDGREIEVTVRGKRYDFADSIFAGVPKAQLPEVYRLGVQLASFEERVPLSVGETVREALAFPVVQTQAIVVGLYEWATGKQKGEVGSVVMITVMLKRSFEAGLIRALELMMLLNVYLGLFNLLPLPALDGGRLVFLGYEMATRRRANPKVEQTVHMVGIMALLVILVLVTYKDIARLFTSS